MGAWGVDVYDNDDAADWAAELEDQGAAAIAAALGAALGDGYLDRDIGARAIAAADVLGRLRTGDVVITNTYGPAEWILTSTASPSADLLRLAERAVDRAVGADSELAELWRETDDFAAWRSSVNTVVGRLL